MGEKKTEIDIYFDFTTDTPGYWENFWNNNNGLGAGKRDPGHIQQNITEISPDPLE